MQPSAAASAKFVQSPEEAGLVPARFTVGQRVECRDPSSCSEGLASWKPGTVTSSSPLKVTRDGHHSFAYEWCEVRPLQAPATVFTVGQRVECRDPSSSSQKLACWKPGTVTSTDPLKVTRDGHHAFAYEWGEVRIPQDSEQTDGLAAPGVTPVAVVDVPKAAHNSAVATKPGSRFNCLQFCHATEAETEIVMDPKVIGEMP